VEALSRNPNKNEGMIDEMKKLYVLLNTGNNEYWLKIAQRQDKKKKSMISLEY